MRPVLRDALTPYMKDGREYIDIPVDWFLCRYCGRDGEAYNERCEAMPPKYQHRWKITMGVKK